MPLLALAIAGGLVQIGSNLIGAHFANKELDHEQDFSDFGAGIRDSRYDIQRDNIGLQREGLGIRRDDLELNRQGAQLSIDRDVRGMERERTQAIGGQRAMAAASGINAAGSSYSDVITDQDDQFIQGIEERKKFGSLQMAGIANQGRDIDLQERSNSLQLADLGLQQQFSDEQDIYQRNKRTRQKTANWFGAGASSVADGIDFATTGYNNNWYQGE